MSDGEEAPGAWGVVFWVGRSRPNLAEIARFCATELVSLEEFEHIVDDFVEDALFVVVGEDFGEIGFALNDAGGEADGHAAAWDGSADERIGADDGAVADFGAWEDEDAPGDGDAVADFDRFEVDAIAFEFAEEGGVSEDEAIAADAGVIADGDGAGGVDEGHLHDLAIAADDEF